MRWRAFTIEHFLVPLIIFTLPFNWFLKRETDTAFLRGIKIDYLLPKLYVQDILLLCLGIYLLYSQRVRVSQWITRQVAHLHTLITHGIKKDQLPVSVRQMWVFAKRNMARFSFAGLVLVMAITSVSSRELSTLMSLWQLSSAFGLAYYLYTRFSFNELLQRIWKPLLATAIFQSIVGIYQFIYQKSLIGYTLFGEIDLSLPGAIARESFFGVLRVLPYGTLPHPNVLAGFLSVASLIAVSKLRSKRKNGEKNILYFIILGLFISVIFLTRSWQAMTGIILVFLWSSVIIRHRYKLLFCLYVIITSLYILLSTWSDYQLTSQTNNQSIIRRFKLNHAGISVLKDHVWFGTGLNQSLKPMHTTYSIIAPADFIQPIHSIYVLWLVETGIIGATLTALFALGILRSITNHQHILSSWSAFSVDKNISLWTSPVLCILWIGIFDHYALTLRQGQLITSLAVALALSSLKRPEQGSSKA